MEQTPIQDSKSVPVPAAVPQAPTPAYYVGTMPAELPSKHPGRIEGIISIVCAAISILFVPILFGVVGILLGVKSKQKGQPTLGLVGIILSSVFMIIGIILGVMASMYAPATKGFLGIL